MAARMKTYYNDEVAPALMKKFGYKSVMQIDRRSFHNGRPHR